MVQLVARVSNCFIKQQASLTKVNSDKTCKKLEEVNHFGNYLINTIMELIRMASESL